MKIEILVSLIFTSLPFVIAFLSAIMMILAYRNSTSRAEARMKIMLFFYFISSVFALFGFILKKYNPELYVLANPFLFLPYLLMPVFFFAYLFTLTQLDKDDKFPYFLYIIALALTVLYLIWANLIPFEMRVNMVKDIDIDAVFYNRFWYYEKSKVLVNSLFRFFIAGLSAYRIYHYTHALKNSPENQIKPSFWLAFILFLIFMQSLMTVTSAIDIRFFNVVNFILPILHIVLVFNVVRRNYLFFTIEDDKEPAGATAVLRKSVIAKTTYRPNPKYKIGTIFTSPSPSEEVVEKKYLDKKKFEDWIKKFKPFLNSNFKITDACAYWNLNRSYMSAFINQEYKMNFNQFVNNCRLKELNRLLKLPSNLQKSSLQLFKNAGFGSYRSYLRAKKILEEDFDNNGV